MKKIVYTTTEGSISVIYPAAKKAIEKVLGPLTTEEYESHIWSRSVPADALNPRYVEDSDIPSTREYRNAWVDVTSESRVDICCEKVRDIALEKLREARDDMLVDNDSLYIMALKDNEDPVDILTERDALLVATDPLKELDVTGKVNDEELLAQIKQLSVLEV